MVRMSRRTNDGNEHWCRDEPLEVFQCCEEGLEKYTSGGRDNPLSTLYGHQGSLQCHLDSCTCKKFTPPGGGSASHPYAAPHDILCQLCEHKASAHGGACLIDGCTCKHLTFSDSLLSSTKARLFGTSCAGCGHYHGDHGGLRLLLRPRPQWGQHCLTTAAVVLWLLPALLAAVVIILDPDAAQLRAECPNTAPGGGWMSIPRFLVVVVCWPLISGVYSAVSIRLANSAKFFLLWFLLFGLLESLILAFNRCVRDAFPLTNLVLVLHSVWWLLWMISVCGAFKLGLTKRLGMEGCEALCKLNIFDICDE